MDVLAGERIAFPIDVYVPAVLSLNADNKKRNGSIFVPDSLEGLFICKKKITHSNIGDVNVEIICYIKGPGRPFTLKTCSHIFKYLMMGF